MFMATDVMGPLSTEETKMSKKFVKFVVDFAVQGKPTQVLSYLLFFLGAKLLFNSLCHFFS